MREWQVMKLLTTLFLLLITLTRTQTLREKDHKYNYAIVTTIRYCELYDPQILEAKRGLESNDVKFFPLYYSKKDFENKYNRSHDWAKLIAIQRVLPAYVDRVLYVDDIRHFHQNHERI